MQLRAEEISNIIKQQIASYDKSVDVVETGTVLTVGDGIARLYGLEGAMAGELLEFPGGVYGMVLNLEEDNVGCAIFGSDVGISEGDTVKRTGRIVEVPVGRRSSVASSTRSASRSTARVRSSASTRAASSSRLRASSRASGQRAAADRAQGHRRDDPHRPRSARAHHR